MSDYEAVSAAIGKRLDSMDYLTGLPHEIEARVHNALRLHEPCRVCVAHHQDHDCPTPHGNLWRCYECAKTRATACRTWRTLTGKETPQ